MNTKEYQRPNLMGFGLAIGLLLVSSVFMLTSCEDSITAVAIEDVRIASLPDRSLVMQSPSDGSVSPAAGIYKVKDGEPFPISATANAGFSFLFWEQLAGTGVATFDDKLASDTTVHLAGGDATIRARIDDTNYTITVTAQTGGSVNLTTLNLDKGVESSGNIIATASAGYMFTDWTVPAGLSTGIVFNPSSTEATIKITANSGDATIQANFVDTQVPTGTVAIQGEILVDGTTYYSKTKAVTVNLTASDNSGSVVLMKLSDTTFGTETTTGWVAMNLSKVFTFSSDGAKTLYVRFKDAAGNESNLYTDTTIVDSTAPVPSRYQVELISTPGSYPDYVSTYTSATLQLNYLATDAGCGVKNVYFSNTASRPAIPQVTSYPAVPVAYPWTISSYDDHNYYSVYFWFEDKLGNISAMFTEPIKYDDKYERNSGNNTADAVSGATIIMDDSSATGYFGTKYRLYTYYEPDWGYAYLVDPDYYKWGFWPLDSSYTYPVEIILYVNNGASTYAAMPQVTFYDHNRNVVPYTYTYPYLNNSQVRYTLTMPYVNTGGYEYFFYMRVQKAETVPYAQRPNYDIYWTFTEDQ